MTAGKQIFGSTACKIRKKLRRAPVRLHQAGEGFINYFSGRQPCSIQWAMNDVTQRIAAAGGWATPPVHLADPVRCCHALFYKKKKSNSVISMAVEILQKKRQAFLILTNTWNQPRNFCRAYDSICNKQQENKRSKKTSDVPRQPVLLVH